MGKTNREVVQAWANNEAAHSSNRNLRTNGQNLYSYQMLIGRTLRDGSKQVLNVRGEFSYSHTTSQHVGLAFGVADSNIDPIVTWHGWRGWREFPPEPKPKPEFKGGFDVIGDIIRYEEGELDEDETIILFQRLVDTGLAWKFPGHYGRTAEALIEAGLVFVDRPYETVGRDPELH